ncbi:MAG: hypothetical protein OJF59_002359 [Cytophagales bacterium]|nr:MAG: hypothetical protein OJF59_002359 [Cytophagales bacterium]
MVCRKVWRRRHKAILLRTGFYSHAECDEAIIHLKLFQVCFSD